MTYAMTPLYAMTENDFKSLVRDAEDMEASAEKYGAGWFIRSDACVIAYALDYILRQNKIRSKVKTYDAEKFWNSLCYKDFAGMSYVMDMFFEHHIDLAGNALHRGMLATMVRALCK